MQFCNTILRQWVVILIDFIRPGLHTHFIRSLHSNGRVAQTELSSFHFWIIIINLDCIVRCHTRIHNYNSGIPEYMSVSPDVEHVHYNNSGIPEYMSVSLDVPHAHTTIILASMNTCQCLQMSQTHTQL